MRLGENGIGPGSSGVSLEGTAGKAGECWKDIMISLWVGHWELNYNFSDNHGSKM